MTTMTNQDRPFQDQQVAPYYEPKPAPISEAQDYGQSNSQKFAVDFISLYVSLVALIILLFATAYYYGFLQQ